MDEFLPIILPALGVLLLTYLYKVFLGIITQKKIKKMDEKYLPVLRITPQEAVSVYKEMSKNNG